MPSPGDPNPKHRGIDWAAIFRTLLVQVVVLVALAGAFVGYINWSSDAVFAEFIEASQPSLRESAKPPAPAIPVQTAKSKAPCRPKG
jgi:hypothetical protein